MHEEKIYNLLKIDSYVSWKGFHRNKEQVLKIEEVKDLSNERIDSMLLSGL